MAVSPSIPVTVPPVNSSATKNTSQYIAFALVPAFFLLGLLGVLICHILKRKGYRCTTEAESEDEVLEEEKDIESATELNDTFSDANTDTVGRIIHYIMKNEANTDALKAMVTAQSIDSDGLASPSPPLSPLEAGMSLSPGTPKHSCSHLHTVGGVIGQKSICSRCNHKKWPLVQQQTRSHASGGVTVLSVGRFRVTKCDPKAMRDRRSMLITGSNVSMCSSPTGIQPKSRTPSESQEKKGKGPI